MPCESSRPILAGETALVQDAQRNIERAQHGRTRIAGIVALEEADVAGPRRPAGVFLLRLQGDERGLTLARENRHVVALHAPVVGEVDDVVGRTHHQRVEIVALHQIADAGELGLVNRVGHRVSG